MSSHPIDRILPDGTLERTLPDGMIIQEPTDANWQRMINKGIRERDEKLENKRILDRAFLDVPDTAEIDGLKERLKLARSEQLEACRTDDYDTADTLSTEINTLVDKIYVLRCAAVADSIN